MCMLVFSLHLFVLLGHDFTRNANQVEEREEVHERDRYVQRSG